MRFLILCLFFIPTLARADTFAGWDFDPPEGYALQPGTFGVTYQGPNGGFIFVPNTPGTDARTAAAAFAAEGLPAGSQRQEIGTQFQDDGSESSLWYVTDGSLHYFQMTVVKDGQSGTALFITNLADTALIDAETNALIAATFAPPAAAVAPQASELPPTAFPPPPPPGRVATTRSTMPIATARAAGIDPDLALLPGIFDCFVTSEPRAADARPDLRIISEPGQRYTLTDGTRSQSGTWVVQPHETFEQIVQLSAPIDDYILLNDGDGLGQTFDLNHPERDADLTCTQDGPPTEALLQQMAAVTPDKGAFDCTGTNGSPFKLLYGNGIYMLGGQRGTYIAALKGGYGDWEGVLNFSGGPYDLEEGTLTYADGTQTLTISETWTEGSAFYSSSETTYTAICRATALARPSPLYGPDPAPPAADPSGGLPEGLFRSFEGRSVFNGTFVNFEIQQVFTLVASGGRMMTDPDFAHFAGFPDCARTTPSGEEVCGEYRTIGPRFSMRDARDFGVSVWSDNETFALTETGFTIGDIAYDRVEPADPAQLPGTWTASSFAGSGPGLGGGVGVYTGGETRWTFGADGRFDWHQNTTSTTLISPDPVLGGASGGGSSSTVDGGAGNWALTAHFLDLTFDDGRTKRLPLFFFAATQDTPASLQIDDTDLARE